MYMRKVLRCISCPCRMPSGFPLKSQQNDYCEREALLKVHNYGLWVELSVGWVARIALTDLYMDVTE